MQRLGFGEYQLHVGMAVRVGLFFRRGQLRDGAGHVLPGLLRPSGAVVGLGALQIDAGGEQRGGQIDGHEVDAALGGAQSLVGLARAVPGQFDQGGGDEMPGGVQRQIPLLVVQGGIPGLGFGSGVRLGIRLRPRGGDPAACTVSKSACSVRLA